MTVTSTESSLDHLTWSKPCSKCGEDKPLSEYHKSSQHKFGVKPRCKSCVSEAHKEAWTNGAKRGSALKRKFGITAEEYDAMLREQNGVCAMCSHPDPLGRRLAVDHNHTTGQVRKLLCGPCNTMIGLARESPDILRQAIAYLEEYNGRTH